MTEGCKGLISSSCCDAGQSHMPDNKSMGKQYAWGKKVECTKKVHFFLKQWENVTETLQKTS